MVVSLYHCKARVDAITALDVEARATFDLLQIMSMTKFGWKATFPEPACIFSLCKAFAPVLLVICMSP